MPWTDSPHLNQKLYLHNSHQNFLEHLDNDPKIGQSTKLFTFENMKWVPHPKNPSVDYSGREEGEIRWCLLCLAYFFFLNLCFNLRIAIINIKKTPKSQLAFPPSPNSFFSSLGSHILLLGKISLSFCGGASLENKFLASLISLIQPSFGQAC